jgi:hypothetical protein
MKGDYPVYLTAMSAPTPLMANAATGNKIRVSIVVDGKPQTFDCETFTVSSIHSLTPITPVSA